MDGDNDEDGKVVPLTPALKPIDAHERQFVEFVAEHLRHFKETHGTLPSTIVLASWGEGKEAYEYMTAYISRDDKLSKSLARAFAAGLLLKHSE